MMGVPGLAKTLLVSTLSQALHLSFKRVQFTPDLMPTDITGSEIIQEGEDGNRHFVFIKGPLFANLVLADEINRTPPKTQAALLEAMQEHRVTVGEQNYDLDEPFFVLATQNPVEQEGTYTLPEAQQDRFMYFITVDYPSTTRNSKSSTARPGAASPTVAARFQCGERSDRGAGHGPRRARSRRTSSRTRWHRPRDPPPARRGGRCRAGFCEAICRVGRRPARGAIPRARRQGARADGRPHACHDRGYPRGRAIRCCRIASF